MLTLLISNNDALGLRIRHCLLRRGIDCPPANMVPVELGIKRLAEINPDLVVAGYSGSPERLEAFLEDCCRLTSAPILVVGPIGDSRQILRFLRHGASEFLDENELEAELEEVLQHLESQSGEQDKPARTIAVLAASGGSGSSTIAVNLATALAQEHEKCLLIDLNLKMGDLAALLDLRPTHSVADLCQNVAAMDRSMLERSLVRHHSGVHLLASPRRQASIIARLAGAGHSGGTEVYGAAAATSIPGVPAQHVNAEGVRHILQMSRLMFPYIVADLPQYFDEEQVQFLRQADTILVVFQLDFHVLRNTLWTLEQLELLGLPADRIHLIVNRQGRPSEVAPHKAEEALNRKIFHFIPDDAWTINKANNFGQPAILCVPRAKVSRSFGELARRI